MAVAAKYPVATITGPRQSGKTTLCRKVFADKQYVSLENLDSRKYVNEDPRGFLAGHLLGIGNEVHVSRNPLRGNLFENLVVIEALKFRLHRGKRSNLSFYRDSSGNEVDLLIGLGPDHFPIEIKAGMTINRDFFKGLDRFAELFPVLHGRGLIYGGGEQQERTDTSVYPALQAHELFARLVEGEMKMHEMHQDFDTDPDSDFEKNA